MNTLFVCNLYEVYIPFFKDTDKNLKSVDTIAPAKISSSTERAYFYLQGSPVVVSGKVPPHEYYLRQLGYPCIGFAPADFNLSICQDLITNSQLRSKILEKLDTSHPINLVAYCNTPEFYELVNYLRGELHLSIEVPEAAESHLSWLRESLVKKSVFAALESSFFSDTKCLVPLHIIVDGYASASAAIHSFLRQGVACVVKPDSGCLGLGLVRFDIGGNPDLGNIEAALRAEIGLDGRRMIVEAWISSGTECQSPSVEVFVPRVGEPYVTYICDQVFSESKLFAGIALRPELYETAWAKTLSDGAMAVAQRLQSLGYCGYFDLDAIVDPDGQVYVVEMNPRRTGGTHVHEMAEFLIGKDYRHQAALLSGSLTLKHPCTWPELEIVLREANLLYPQGTVIPVQTSSLSWGVFGYVVMAADWDTVQFWQKRLLALLT